MDFEEYRKHKSLTTPDGYFDTLNRNIEKATCRKNKTTARKRRLTPKITSIMSYAAMFAIVAFIAVRLTTEKRNRNEKMVMVQATEWTKDREYIESLLASYTIDEYTFYCCLTEEE